MTQRNLISSKGPLSSDRSQMVRQAMALIEQLEAHERTLIFCWFCHHCGKYWGPGEAECKCCDETK